MREIAVNCELQDKNFKGNKSIGFMAGDRFWYP